MDFLIVLVIAGIFFAWRLMPTKGITQISTADLKKEVQNQSKQVIDVRTPSEYKINHIRAFKKITNVKGGMSAWY